MSDAGTCGCCGAKRYAGRYDARGIHTIRDLCDKCANGGGTVGKASFVSVLSPRQKRRRETPVTPVLCEWCRTEPAAPGGIYCSTRHRVAAFRERKRLGILVGVTSAGVTRVTRNEDLVTPVTVAALYVRADGPYTHLDGVDAWPRERDATRYEGPGPVVAHPPCAPWGRYRTIAPSRQRADLAVRAVDQVRWYGGVLEHPASSHLWTARELPQPGEKPDMWGGWSMLIRQSWWGHRAPKPTWIYIVGRGDTPPLPLPVEDPGGRINQMDQDERELTPPALAAWLVDLARGCTTGKRRFRYRALSVTRAARPSVTPAPPAGERPEETRETSLGARADTACSGDTTGAAGPLVTPAIAAVTPGASYDDAIDAILTAWAETGHKSGGTA